MKKLDKPNYTQIPNVLLDSMPDFTDAELRLMLAICRQTFGWLRERHKMSLSFLCKATGMSHQGVINACHRLAEKGLIERTREGESFTYSLVVENVPCAQQITTENTPEPLNGVDYPLSTPLTTPSQRRLYIHLNGVETPPLNGVETKKEIVVKEKEKKAPLAAARASRANAVSSLPIPDPLNTPAFLDAWTRWQQHRRERRCPLTPTCAAAQLKKLAAIGPAAAAATINRSIENGWQGLFPEKVAVSGNSYTPPMPANPRPINGNL